MPETLHPDDMLSAEFEYIAQTAFQAHEDRARVTTFYLVAVGSFVAAILGAQFEAVDSTFVNSAFVVLFGVLSVMSVLTILQLVRLREAWFDSVAAMNRIKDYYVEHDAELKSAFMWSTGTIPAKFKRWSVAYLLAFQVSVLGGATLGAGVVFAGYLFGGLWWWQAVVAGVVYVTVQMVLHRVLLSK